MSRVLVTGGAGFIGSHLVDRLIKAKHKVSVIDDLSGGYKRNINPKATFYQIDLRDPYWVKEAFMLEKPEIVYHLAANAAENKAQFSPVDITSRNYEAFINTLTYAIKYKMKRFIFTSSIAVYGEGQVPFKENDKPEPEDLYGITKLAAEESLKIMSKIHNFEYVIARPHNVYGPRQDMGDPYRNVVTIFMNAILQNKPYYIYGNGEQRRCFSYIDEVADALFKCGFENVHEQIFNIGADKDYSVNELAETIIKVSETRNTPLFLPKRPQEVDIAISDHSMAKKILGYEDKTSLLEGIQKTWDYAKTLGPQKLKKTVIEIPNDKMPENWK